MANLHNTLYVTSEGAYVSKSGETAIVKVDGAVRMQVPLHHLVSIVCFGWAGVSPELMGACTEAGISMAFLSPTGRFLASVEGPPSGNVLLRRAQYRAADDLATTAALSRAFVAGKIANSRSVLQRGLRDGPDREGAATLDKEGRRRLRKVAQTCKDFGVRVQFSVFECSWASATGYAGAVADLFGGRRGLEPESLSLSLRCR